MENDSNFAGMAKAKQTNAAGETKIRTTIFVYPSFIHKLDYIAKMDYINSHIEASRADKVNQALEEFISRWEKKNGNIPPK